MKKMKRPFYFLFAGAVVLLTFFAARASAGDCYVDCMLASGCWGARSDENVSYCSDTEATCTVRCMHAGGRSYGAIAYSPKNGAYGFSDSWPDQKKAEETALGYCSKNGKGCKIQVWFYDSCGAVAAGSGGRKTGWGQGDSAGEAGQQALEKCKKSGGENCEIKTSHCSR